MKRFVMVIFLIVSSIGMGRAEDGFDNDLSIFRKKVFINCAELQKSNVVTHKIMLNQIDQILSTWDTISSKYKNNPPQEYSGDPGWTLYFDEAKDNFMLMRENLAKKNIKRAVQFCGSNCMLFVKIHKINGTETLSDKMFDLRSAAKMLLLMASAGNWKGVDNQSIKCNSLMKELTIFAQNHVKNGKQKDSVKKVGELWNGFIQKVQSHDIKTIKDGWVEFLTHYNQIYYQIL